jgi:hypothetical protein
MRDNPVDKDASGKRKEGVSRRSAIDPAEAVMEGKPDTREGVTEHIQQQNMRQPSFAQTKPESKKPSIRDVAAGPMRPFFPAERVWEKAKKVYQAVDTPEERTTIKNKVKEAWNIFKGPRSTKVDN